LPSLCGETMPSAVRSSRSGTTVTVGFDVVVFRSRLMPVCSADSSGRSVNISEMEGGRFSGFPASPSGAEGGGVLTLNTGVLPFFLRDHREARLGAMAGTANSTGSPAWALWTFPLVLRWYVAMGLPCDRNSFVGADGGGCRLWSSPKSSGRKAAFGVCADPGGHWTGVSPRLRACR